MAAIQWLILYLVPNVEIPSSIIFRVLMRWFDDDFGKAGNCRDCSVSNPIGARGLLLERRMCDQFTFLGAISRMSLGVINYRLQSVHLQS
jgi:hypothetical protein